MNYPHKLCNGVVQQSKPPHRLPRCQWERRLAGFDRHHDRPTKGIISNIVSRVLYAAGHPIAQNGAPITIGAYQFLVKVPSILRCRQLGFSMPMHSDEKKKIRGLLLLVAIVPIIILANLFMLSLSS